MLTNEEHQRFQNHLQIQLNQMSQGEPQNIVHQQPVRIPQQQQLPPQQPQPQQPQQQQSREQPIKLQKSFVDGDLDFVSLFSTFF